MACSAVELVLPACVRELEVNEEDVRAIVGRELREIDDRVCEFDEGVEQGNWVFCPAGAAPYMKGRL